MKKKLSDDLPDYTVADMNVDGMPWNTRRPWQLLGGVFVLAAFLFLLFCVNVWFK